MQEEREQKLPDLSVSLYPNYPISPLPVSRGRCTEGCRHEKRRLGKGASVINHTYISHLFKDGGGEGGGWRSVRLMLSRIFPEAQSHLQTLKEEKKNMQDNMDFFFFFFKSVRPRAQLQRHTVETVDPGHRQTRATATAWR